MTHIHQGRKLVRLGSAWLLPVALVAGLMPAATAQTTVKVPVGSKVQITIQSPMSGCTSVFGVFSNSNSTAVNVTPNFLGLRKKAKFTFRGLSLGMSQIVLDYKLKDTFLGNSSGSCLGSGALTFNVEVTNDPAVVAKGFAKSAKTGLKGTNSEIKQGGKQTRTKLLMYGLDLKKGTSDPDTVLADAFDAVLCGRFNTYMYVQDGLTALRDAGTASLSSQSITEACKPAGLQDGACDTWDIFQGRFWSAGDKGISRIAKDEKKFYKAVEKFSDFAITGTYSGGMGYDLPGPTGSDVTALSDPPLGLCIQSTWAIGYDNAGTPSGWIMTGGMADPGLGNVTVSLTGIGGISASKTVTPAVDGKWSADFTTSDGLVPGVSVGLKAGYATPTDDSDETDIFIPAISLKLSF